MIAIPNMEKPKNCYACSFNDGIFCALIDNDTDAFIKENPTEVATKVLPNCPLIEIVQCKDCKYWHDHEWSSTCDKHIGNGFPSDYFCADGKRRSE